MGRGAKNKQRQRRTTARNAQVNRNKTPISGISITGRGDVFEGPGYVSMSNAGKRLKRPICPIPGDWLCPRIARNSPNGLQSGNTRENRSTKKKPPTMRGLCGAASYRDRENLSISRPNHPADYRHRSRRFLLTRP